MKVLEKLYKVLLEFFGVHSHVGLTFQYQDENRHHLSAGKTLCSMNSDKKKHVLIVQRMWIKKADIKWD